MTVAAVIPHWNRRDLLAALMENLRRQRRAFDRVIVADNGSTDASAEMAERAGACALRLGANLGFAAAVNRAIEAAECDWVAILNNDVTLDPGWLETLLEVAAREHAWFAAGKILSASHPNVVDGCFDEIARSGCAWRCGAGRPDSPAWNQFQRIRIAPMTAALFRRDLFRHVGPLDERFESYLEDVDFGIRCSLQGFAGVYAPSALAWHLGSATAGKWSSDTVRRISRNQFLLAAKHFGGQPLWPIVWGQLLWGLVALRHGKLLSYLRGKWEGYRRRPPIGPAPSQIHAFLKESERTIFELQRRTGFDLYWRIYFWLSAA